ncbi:ABC transporter permease [Mesobacillus boroniphilus]|uniref:ABC transporter permease n=1 Tax=Mesobacillus boroniphilus TaxID=308892 RepID=A0A944GWC7_9BACI|nr:ABC transporter permease [Mesobacillus boroniphilus]MBS8264519.1 ABC transporter permease [Mesobacillus boroniphilus]
MKQWFTLINKEFLEMARNYKWIWMPITFILLGVMDPLTTYYLPEILNSVGGLPEGAVFEMPEPSAQEVFIMSLGEYQMIGILVIVLSTMGTVAGERKSGVAQLILVKPVSYVSYITSKWAAALILIVISLFLGMLASWYYIGVLFEFISFGRFMESFGLYSLWIVLVLSFVILCSALFMQPVAAGMVALVTVFIFTIIGGSFQHLLEWSPTQLISYVSERLITEKWPEHVWPATGMTLSMIFVFIGLAIYFLKRKELAD